MTNVGLIVALLALLALLVGLIRPRLVWPGRSIRWHRLRVAAVYGSLTILAYAVAVVGQAHHGPSQASNPKTVPPSTSLHSSQPTASSTRDRQGSSPSSFDGVKLIDGIPKSAIVTLQDTHDQLIIREPKNLTLHTKAFLLLHALGNKHVSFVESPFPGSCRAGTPTMWLIYGLPRQTVIERYEVVSGSRVLIVNTPSQTLMPIDPKAGGFIVSLGKDTGSIGLQLPDPALPNDSQIALRFTVMLPDGSSESIATPTFQYPPQPNPGCAQIPYGQTPDAAERGSGMFGSLNVAPAPESPGFYWVTPLLPSDSDPFTSAPVTWQLVTCEWISQDGPRIVQSAAALHSGVSAGFGYDSPIPNQITFATSPNLTGTHGHFVFLYRAIVLGKPLDSLVPVLSQAVTLPATAVSSAPTSSNTSY